jgi:sulfur transfer complex TusBCD TusB component (DsrH family)
MLRKKKSYKDKKYLNKIFLLWILSPLVFFTQLYCINPAAIAQLAVGALHLLKTVCYSYYGLHYQNAYNINHEIPKLQQLHPVAVQQVYDASYKNFQLTNQLTQQPIITPNNYVAFAKYTPQHNYTPLFKPINATLAPQALTYTTTQSANHGPLFKLAPSPIARQLHTQIVSTPTKWSNFCVQGAAGGQSFQHGIAHKRFENIAYVSSTTDLILHHAHCLDHLQAKAFAVQHSPIVHTYMGNTQALFDKVITSGVNAAQAHTFTANITQLYDAISMDMSRVSVPEAAVLNDMRHGLYCLMDTLYTKQGDFIGAVTNTQKQAAVDIYARMLGDVTQSGFKKTLDASIAAGAHYLIPARDYYFPQGIGKLLTPVRMLRTTMHNKVIDVASSWRHGEHITDKIRSNALNNIIGEVRTLMQLGFVDAASGRVENFNPAYNHDGMRDYNHYYTALQEVLTTCKLETLNDLGIPKIFEQHPQWSDLRQALINDPSCKQQVLYTLEHEQAIAINILQQLQLPSPSTDQLKTVYDLCNYSTMPHFEQTIANINSFADVQKAMDTLANSRTTHDALRSCFAEHGFAPHQYEPHVTKLAQWADDPQFASCVQITHEHQGTMHDLMHVLAERERASTALLTRCDITQPSAITKQISYQLIDTMHNPSRMIEVLSTLDPHHVDPMMRQAYYDFFDAQGIQKVIPLDDQVRTLIADRMGTINLALDPEMRNACNQLSLFTITNPQELDVITRGLNYIELGLTSGTHNNVIRDYATKYAQALAQPHEDALHILSMSDLVNSYMQPMPADIKALYGDVLARALTNHIDKELQYECMQSLTQELQTAAMQIQANDFVTARTSLESAVHTHTQPKPTTLYRAETSSDLAYVTRHELPHRVTTSYGSAQQTLQRQQAAILAKLQEQISSNQNSNSKSTDPYALALRLLKKGKFITQTKDGVVVAFENSTFAHVAADGSVDMMTPSKKTEGQFARSVYKTAQHGTGSELTRTTLLDVAHDLGATVSHHAAPHRKSIHTQTLHADAQTYPLSSSSHGIGDIEDLGKLLDQFAKARHNNAQPSFGETVCAGGGDPDDPRNNRNQWKQPEHEVIATFKTLEDILKNAQRGNITNGPSRIFEKSGDFNDVLLDFHSMGATIVKTIPKGIVGRLPDGRYINARSSSSNGPQESAPTLEIQEMHSNKVTKIRYRN